MQQRNSWRDWLEVLVAQQMVIARECRSVRRRRASRTSGGCRRPDGKQPVWGSAPHVASQGRQEKPGTCIGRDMARKGSAWADGYRA